MINILGTHSEARCKTSMKETVNGCSKCGRDSPLDKGPEENIPKAYKGCKKCFCFCKKNDLSKY